MFTKEFLFLFIRIFLLVLLGYVIFRPIFSIIRKLSRLTIRDLKTLMKMYKYKRLVVDHSVNHALLLAELLLKASDYMFGQIEVECIEDIMNMTIHCKNTNGASAISIDGIINKDYPLTEYFNQLEEIAKVASYDKCNLHIIID